MTTEEKLLKKILREQRKWKERASKGQEPPNFKTLSDALDSYYFISKLKVYCAYLSYSKIKNAANLPFKEADLKYIQTILATEEDFLQENPVFKIYNSIRQLFENIEKESGSNDQLYEEIHQLIKKHHRLFDREEKLNLYSLLSNFCIRNINLGVIAYKSQFFLVNNQMLNIKYGQPKSKDVPLPFRLYKNMVSMAILQKEATFFESIETKGLPVGVEKNFKDGLDWAAHFTEIYQYKLEKKGRTVYYAYCSGLIYFIKKEYLNAYHKIKKLTHVHFPFLHLDLKTLQLRVFYEINKSQPEVLDDDNIQIEKMLEAFRGMLRYEKNQGKRLTYQLTQYIDFEKLFRKLFTFYNSYNGQLLNTKKPDYQKGKTDFLDLLQSSSFQYQRWFLEQLEQIK